MPSDAPKPNPPTNPDPNNPNPLPPQNPPPSQGIDRMAIYQRTYGMPQ